MDRHTRSIGSRNFQVNPALSAMKRRKISDNGLSVRILEEIINRTMRHLPHPFLDLRRQRFGSSVPQTVLQLGDIAIDRCIKRARYVETGRPVDDFEQDQCRSAEQPRIEQGEAKTRGSQDPRQGHGHNTLPL
jgi:hypothetical protein